MPFKKDRKYTGFDPKTDSMPKYKIPKSHKGKVDQVKIIERIGTMGKYRANYENEANSIDKEYARVTKLYDAQGNKASDLTAEADKYRNDAGYLNGLYPGTAPQEQRGVIWANAQKKIDYDFKMAELAEKQAQELLKRSADLRTKIQEAHQRSLEAHRKLREYQVTKGKPYPGPPPPPPHPKPKSR